MILLFSSIWAWWSDILDTPITIVILCVEINPVHFRLLLIYFVIVVCVCVSVRYGLLFNYMLYMDFESVNKRLTKLKERPSFDLRESL